MLIREEIIQKWTNLKEKVNSLKLSETDKQAVNFLNQCPIKRFISSKVKDYELDSLEKEITEFEEKSHQLDFDNVLIWDWLDLAFNYSMTILNWIELKKSVIELIKLEKILKETQIIIKFEASQKDTIALADKIRTDYPSLTVLVNLGGNYWGEGHEEIEEID